MQYCYCNFIYSLASSSNNSKNLKKGKLQPTMISLDLSELFKTYFFEGQLLWAVSAKHSMFF